MAFAEQAWSSTVDMLTRDFSASKNEFDPCTKASQSTVKNWSGVKLFLFLPGEAEILGSMH